MNCTFNQLRTDLQAGADWAGREGEGVGDGDKGELGQADKWRGRDNELACAEVRITQKCPVFHSRLKTLVTTTSATT